MVKGGTGPAGIWSSFPREDPHLRLPCLSPPHLRQKELSKAGEPPLPRVAATQLRKGGLSWAANKWIKETWEEMNDVTKSEGSRGPNSLLPRTLAQNRSDYFGHDATMTTKLNSCLQYISAALSTCIGGRMKSESLIKAFLVEMFKLFSKCKDKHSIISQHNIKGPISTQRILFSLFWHLLSFLRFRMWHHTLALSDAFSSILPSQLIEFNLNQNTRWIDIVETLHTNRLRATRELKFSFQTLSCLLLSSSPSAGPSRHISSETFVNFHSGTFRGDLSITACQYFTFQMTLPFYEVISSHLSNFHLLPE